MLASKEVTTQSDIEKIFREFLRQLALETDYEAILEGILPLRAVFDLRQFDFNQNNSNFSIHIINEGNLKCYNFRRIFGLPAKAIFRPWSKTIMFPDPKLTLQQTLSLCAYPDEFVKINGQFLAFTNLEGITLAHEVVHALQQPSNIAEKFVPEPKLPIKEVFSKLISKHFGSSPTDWTIITETQAYLMQYMLGGPFVPSSQMLRHVQKEKGRNESWGEIEIGGIKLQDLPSSGRLPVVPSITDHILKTYFHFKGRRKQEELARKIKSCCTTMIIALQLGMTHKMMADLIKKNYQMISSEGAKWNNITQTYPFLYEAIRPFFDENKLPLTDKDINDLIQAFEDATAERVSKLAYIASQQLRGTQYII